MLVKTRDAVDSTIETLVWRGRNASDAVTRAAYVSAAARLRADPTTEAATKFIDKNFADTQEWAVIHDLRFRVGTRALQLNHVLISNSLDIVCIDSRYMNFGLEFHADDKCNAFTAYESRAISSPLNKMSRDVRLINEHINGSRTLPRKFGLGPRAAVMGYIITDPSLRLQGREPSKRDSVAVLSSDALFPMLWKKGTRWSQTRIDRLSPEALLETAERLIAHHEPTVQPSLLAHSKAA